MFANFNRSVRSLALDMKQPESVDLVLRLASVADVVIENYGPDVLERWGIGYEKIAAVNPRIVMLSQTGFGHTEGPRSHYLAYGATIFSFMGLAQIWGRSHGTHLDYPAAAHGLFAILAALAARDRTGQGTHIDQAQIEVAGAIMGPMLLDYLVNGHEPGEDPPPGLVVRCLGDDGWLAVEPEDDEDWQRPGRGWSARPTPATTPRSPKRSGPGPRADAAAGDADAAAGRPGRRRGPEQRGRDPRPRSTANGISCRRWIIPISAWPSTPRRPTGWPRRRP